MATVILSSVLVVVYFVACSELKAVNSDVNTEKEELECSQPHIIFILADDMGWNDVSFHGSDEIPTPNIDALAYNGVILNNHYVQPVCTPTRAALLTGKYPMHTGMQGNPLLASERRGLPLKEKTMAEHLKELGYSTQIVGKWHLGYYQVDYTPQARGFDSYFGYFNGAISYYDHIMQELGRYNKFAGHDFRRNYTTAWEYQGKYATDVFTEEAENIIHNHDPEKPLFLYLSHLATHSGNEGKLLEAPQETIDKFTYIHNPNRRTYAAMVSKLDESVGRVVSALQEKEMLSNSIIVFLSDNGAPTTGVFRNWGSNQPFRGEKGTLWEASVRTPAVIWSPLIESSSRVSKQLMHVTDWLPTLYIAAGGSPEDLSKELDGLNMWPSITQNETSPRNQIVLNIDSSENYGAIVAKNDNETIGEKGTFKLIIGKSNLNNGFNDLDETSNTYNVEKVIKSPANKAIRKVVNCPLSATTIEKLRDEATEFCPETNNATECNGKCLFNLDKDPCEKSDISETNGGILQYMQDLYNAQAKTEVPKLPSVFDAEANPALHNYTWSTWVPAVEYEVVYKDEYSSDKKLFEYEHVL